MGEIHEFNCEITLWNGKLPAQIEFDYSTYVLWTMSLFSWVPTPARALKCKPSCTPQPLGRRRFDAYYTGQKGRTSAKTFYSSARRERETKTSPALLLLRWACSARCPKRRRDVLAGNCWQSHESVTTMGGRPAHVRGTRAFANWRAVAGAVTSWLKMLVFLLNRYYW